MGFFRKPSAAEYAVGAGDLGALGTKEGLGNCPSSAVPFIIQCWLLQQQPQKVLSLLARADLTSE